MKPEIQRRAWTQCGVQVVFVSNGYAGELSAQLLPPSSRVPQRPRASGVYPAQLVIGGVRLRGRSAYIEFLKQHPLPREGSRRQQSSSAMLAGTRGDRVHRLRVVAAQAHHRRHRLRPSAWSIKHRHDNQNRLIVAHVSFEPTQALPPPQMQHQPSGFTALSSESESEGEAHVQSGFKSLYSESDSDSDMHLSVAQPGQPQAQQLLSHNSSRIGHISGSQPCNPKVGPR